MERSFIEFDRYKWRKIAADYGQSFKIRYDYAILGCDPAAGTLDMLVRWYGDGGHCPLHRHVSTTTVLVLAGEQHLWDVHPDGARSAHRVRCAGDYALSGGDALPHLERGGAEGGVAFFSNHTSDGRLYEIFDEHMKLVANVSIDSLIADWKANT